MSSGSETALPHPGVPSGEPAALLQSHGGNGARGGRWYCGRGADGKRVYRNETVKGTKKDAQKRLNAILSARDSGSYVEPGEMPLWTYLEEWLETKEKSRKVRPRTLAGYRTLLTKHVKGVLGDRRLRDLTTDDVQRLINGMSDRANEKKSPRAKAKRPLSPRTHQVVHRVLKQALGKAVARGLLVRNPAEGVELRKQEAREKRAFSADEVGEFRKAAKGTKHEALWEFLLGTGCRPGEALALTWDDLENGSVIIRRALTLDADRKPLLAAPKTRQSVRTIALPHQVLKALEAHRKAQAEHALKAGPVYDRDAKLVFANEVGAPLDVENLRKRHYTPLCKAAKIEGDRGPYDLRHNHATLLLAAGENVKVISERLGHRPASMTLDVYSHVLPNLQESATRRVEELLG